MPDTQIPPRKFLVVVTSVHLSSNGGEDIERELRRDVIETRKSDTKVPEAWGARSKGVFTQSSDIISEVELN